MLGGDTLSAFVPNSSIFDTLNLDKSTMNNRELCLTEAYTEKKTMTTVASATTTIASATTIVASAGLQEDDGGVLKLSDTKFETFEDSSLYNTDDMKGIILSSKMLKNESKVVVLLEEDGKIRVWRTSKGGTYSKSKHCSIHYCLFF